MLQIIMSFKYGNLQCKVISLQMVTSENVANLKQIALIASALATGFGFLILCHEIYNLYNRKRWTRYLIMVAILKLIAMEMNLLNLLIFYFPLESLSDVTYRIVKLVTYWPTFVYHLLLMLSDMEMLRLLHVITPFFTARKITIIQISESIFTFIVGGGLLYWPFSDFGSVAFAWGSVSILLAIASLFAVVCQCIYITYKMRKFAKSSKKLTENSEWNYRKSICLILVYMSIMLLSGILLFMAIQQFMTSLNGPAYQYGELLLTIANTFAPFGIFVYSLIFESIIGIKFDQKVKHHDQAHTQQNK